MPNNTLEKKLLALAKIVTQKDQGILFSIDTGKYNKEEVKVPYSKFPSTINKCNLFVDDMASKFWGVSLPRLGQTSPQTIWKGHKKTRPCSASDMLDFFNGMNKFEGNGINKVNRDQAANEANLGKLVIALSENGAHTSIMAPNKSRPMIYRSDLLGRGKDKRKKVGVGESFNFFLIDPDKYNRYRQKGSRGHSDESMKIYGMADNSETIILDEEGRYRLLSDATDPFAR